MENSANATTIPVPVGVLSNVHGYKAEIVACALRALADEIEGREGEAIGSMMVDEAVNFIERLGEKYEEFLHRG